MPDEINRAEVMALLLGLQWASAEFTDCHFYVYCDNSSVVSTLTKGTGTLWRHHDLRRLHLSTLHGLRGNTFEILQVSSAQDPVGLFSSHFTVCGRLSLTQHLLIHPQRVAVNCILFLGLSFSVPDGSLSIQRSRAPFVF